MTIIRELRKFTSESRVVLDKASELSELASQLKAGQLTREEFDILTSDLLCIEQIQDLTDDQNERLLIKQGLEFLFQISLGFV